MRDFKSLESEYMKDVVKDVDDFIARYGNILESKLLKYGCAEVFPCESKKRVLELASREHMVCFFVGRDKSIDFRNELFKFFRTKGFTTDRTVTCNAVSITLFL